jgi:hypothetical protein
MDFRWKEQLATLTATAEKGCSIQTQSLDQPL